MNAIAKWSAARMAKAVREREVSAVELHDAHAARVGERDPHINALVLPRLEAAREEAVAADAALARGEPVGPLHGVPFTVKEVIAVAGMPAPNGSRLTGDYVPDADAEIVARLRRAGAILLGKTNISELSSFWDSCNPVFGATLNPHDRTRTSGGSSGGEAAALAAAMTPLGIGSDLGGSIRNPAHFCGVLGLKAGRGTLPLARHHPLPLSPGVRLFATLGPLARHVEDLELALDVLAAPLPPALAPARVAVFEEDGLQPVSRACREAVRRAALALHGAGHEPVDAAPPDPAAVRAAYDTVLATEAAWWAPAVVGDRIGDVSPYIAALVGSVRDFTPVLGDYLAAFDRLAALEERAQEWLVQHPIALCPVAPDVAPPSGTTVWPPVDGEPTRPGGKLTLCTYANALGLPAVAVPVMRSPDEGLPVGVQLFGAQGSERTLLAAARVLEEAFGGWLDPDESP